jgi:hypothetical protein
MTAESTISRGHFKRVNLSMLGWGYNPLSMENGVDNAHFLAWSFRKNTAYLFDFIAFYRGVC